jgi:hypothetical protein
MSAVIMGFSLILRKLDGRLMLTLPLGGHALESFAYNIGAALNIVRAAHTK